MTRSRANKKSSNLDIPNKGNGNLGHVGDRSNEEAPKCARFETNTEMSGRTDARRNVEEPECARSITNGNAPHLAMPRSDIVDLKQAEDLGNDDGPICEQFNTDMLRLNREGLRNSEGTSRCAQSDTGNEKTGPDHDNPKTRKDESIRQSDRMDGRTSELVGSETSIVMPGQVILCESNDGLRATESIVSDGGSRHFMPRGKSNDAMHVRNREDSNDPMCKFLNAASNASKYPKLLTRSETPKFAMSGTSSKETKPRQDRPSTDAARSVCAKLRETGGKSRCVGSKADRAMSSCANPRGGDEELDWTRSGIAKGGPVQAIPDGEGGSPV